MGNHRPGIAIPSINPGKLAQLSTHQTPGAVPGFYLTNFHVVIWCQVGQCG